MICAQLPRQVVPVASRTESAIGRLWVALSGMRLVGRGVDRGGELLAHASAEMTGVDDHD
jgi:hypothetical protein